MPNRHNKLVAIFLFFCLPVFAATSANDELTTLLNNTHTMRAGFTQTSLNNKGKEVGQKTIGTMALVRPGKFRWETLKPNKQLIIINKDSCLIYDVDLEQVTKKKNDYKTPGNPAVLLSGTSKQLNDMFAVKKIKSSGKKTWFELTPKNKNSDYQLIKMHFDGVQIKTMSIASGLNQTVEIGFSKIVLNSKIRSSKFEFVVPKGVDVINEG